VITLTSRSKQFQFERVVRFRGSIRRAKAAGFRPFERSPFPGPATTKPALRSRTRMRYCQELRCAFAVFKSVVSKPSLKRSYTDCRRLRASAIRP
jgi:hypothetical protein